MHLHCRYLEGRAVIEFISRAQDQVQYTRLDGATQIHVHPELECGLIQKQHFLFFADVISYNEALLAFLQEGHVKAETETGMKLLQAKDLRPPPKLREPHETHSPLVPTLISGVWLPEIQEDNFTVLRHQDCWTPPQYTQSVDSSNAMKGRRVSHGWGAVSGVIVKK